MLVHSPVCDSMGYSYKWYYIFHSESLQKNFEIWYKNGQVIIKDSVTIPWQLGEEDVPFTHSWIDSDSAIVIGNASGGTDYMSSHEILHIGMTLRQIQSGWHYWNIVYQAEDSNFIYQVNAY